MDKNARDARDGQAEKGALPEVTQSFADDQLAESIAQLGPRTTVHASGTAADVIPKFGDWVRAWLADQVPRVEEKAATYGTNSLARKGNRYASAIGQSVTVGQALELGVDQYAIEKADRIEDAISRGQLPTADTLADLAIYALMALYIRAFGTWG